MTDSGRGSILSGYGFQVILLAMVIISYIPEPAFLTPRNLLNVLLQMSMTTIIAFGTTLRKRAVQ